VSTTRMHKRRSRSLLRCIGDLLRSWWQVDRIRVSPSAGRLLRLQPGNIVGIADRDIEVVSRCVSQSPSGSSICYQCRSADGSAQLCVTPVVFGVGERITWTEKDLERSLTADEVEVWG
jgi:hypothetical protein